MTTTRLERGSRGLPNTVPVLRRRSNKMIFGEYEPVTSKGSCQGERKYNKKSLPLVCLCQGSEKAVVSNRLYHYRAGRKVATHINICSVYHLNHPQFPKPVISIGHRFLAWGLPHFIYPMLKGFHSWQAGKMTRTLRTHHPGPWAPHFPLGSHVGTKQLSELLETLGWASNWLSDRFPGNLNSKPSRQEYHHHSTIISPNSSPRPRHSGICFFVSQGRAGPQVAQQVATLWSAEEGSWNSGRPRNPTLILVIWLLFLWQRVEMKWSVDGSCGGCVAWDFHGLNPERSVERNTCMGQGSSPRKHQQGQHLQILWVVWNADF